LPLATLPARNASQHHVTPIAKTRPNVMPTGGFHERTRCDLAPDSRGTALPPRWPRLDSCQALAELLWGRTLREAGASRDSDALSSPRLSAIQPTRCPPLRLTTGGQAAAGGVWYRSFPTVYTDDARAASQAPAEIGRVFAGSSRRKADSLLPSSDSRRSFAPQPPACRFVGLSMPVHNCAASAS
jgi:hypothetical protein